MQVATKTAMMFGEMTKNKTQESSIDGSFAAMIGNLAEDDPAEMLKEITEDGIASMWKWQIKKLKEKVASEIMQEMSLTPEQIAAMPDAQRVSVEQKIMQEVERRVKEMIEQGMHKKKGLPFAADSGNLDSTTLQTLLFAAQKS